MAIKKTKSAPSTKPAAGLTHADVQSLLAKVVECKRTTESQAMVEAARAAQKALSALSHRLADAEADKVAATEKDAE